LQNHKREKEIFRYLSDSLLFSRNYSLLDEKCYFCKSSTHLFLECKLMFANKDQARIRLSFENKINHFIKVFQRKNRAKYHSIKQILFTDKRAQKYIFDNEDLFRNTEHSEYEYEEEN